MIRMTLTILSFITLAACGGSGSSRPPDAPIATVSVGKATKGEVAERVPLYGAAEVVPAGQRTIVAPVEAVVEKISMPVGSHVKKGQVVLQLTESPTARIDLARASADASAADQAYARAKRLQSDGLAGNPEVEAARAVAATADAVRDSLLTRHAALQMKAPIAGYVVGITAAPGDLVASGSAVATLVQANEMRARLGIDSTFLPQMTPGASLTLTPSAGGSPIQSHIISVTPIVDPGTRLATVFASIPANTQVSQGDQLTGELDLKTAADTITIPYGSLLDDGGQPFVYAVAGSVAHRHDVTVAAMDGKRASISKGLQAGDEVVTDGATALSDGMKVKVK